MNDFNFEWDQVVTFFYNTLDAWNALSFDRKAAYGFMVLCFVNIVVVWLYRSRLVKVRKQVKELAKPANLNDFIVNDNAAFASAIVEHSQCFEEFTKELMDKFHQSHREALDAVKDLATDNTSRTVTAINAAISGLGEQFTEVLDKVATQQANSNKLLADTVSEMMATFQNTHAETMGSVNNLSRCIENVYANDDDDDEDDE